MYKLPGYERAITDELEREIIRQSIVTDASRKLTICEQIRFTYDLVDQLPDSEIKSEIIEQLIDVFGSGKKMNARLAHYHRHYEPKDGKGGRSIKNLYSTNKRKSIRRKRI